MPFLIDYTAESGANFPDSWWVLGNLNLDFPNKTVTLVMKGYLDRDAYRADPNSPIESLLFSYTDPIVFDTVFYILSYGAIDNYLYIGAPFIPEAGEYPFTGATSTYARTDADIGYSGFVPVAGGLDGNTKVYVQFTEDLDTGLNYTSGVVIKVNGTPATIVSGVRQTSHKVILYTLAAAINNAETITYEYDPNAGAQIVEEDTTAAVGPVPAISLTNLLGAAYGFNVSNNSGHVAHL